MLGLCQPKAFFLPRQLCCVSLVLRGVMCCVASGENFGMHTMGWAGKCVLSFVTFPKVNVGGV